MASSKNDFHLDFVGIGAAKAGTTWLNTCINEHPEVLISIKELSFFNDVGGIYDKFLKKYSRGCDWYKKQFPIGENTDKSVWKWYFDRYPPVKRSRLIGDFTVDYLTDFNVAKRIYRHFPKTKIIVCLRDPINRAYSHYIWYRKNFNFEKADTFEKALMLQPEYVRRSLYFENLNPFIELFGLKNIHVVFYRNIQNKPRKVLKDVYKFLGIDSSYEPKCLFSKINKAGKSKNKYLAKLLLVPKLIRESGLATYWYPFSRSLIYIKLQSWYTKINVKEYNYSLLDAETRYKVLPFFIDDINKLEKLLEKDLSSWKH